MKYLTLDITRGLAAISVLITHWALWTSQYQNSITKKIIHVICFPLEFIWHGGGIHPGVIVFIVLSGFCIHLPCAKNPDLYKYKNHWCIYIKRRAIRIFPVYWLGLILGIISILIVDKDILLSDKQIQIALSFIVSFAGLSEIARYTNQFAYLYWGNGPLNTVAVEMILYATYPILYVLHATKKNLYLIFFCCLNYLLIVALRYFDATISLKATYFEFITYWVWGAVCVELSVNYLKKPNAIKILMCLILSLVSAYLCLIYFLHIKGFHVITTNLFAIIVGLILTLLTKSELHYNKRLLWLCLKPLSIVGQRGYSLYAVHTPIIFLVMWGLCKTNFATWLFPWVILISVTAVTEICYRYVERPTHLLSQRMSTTIQSIKN